MHVYTQQKDRDARSLNEFTNKHSHENHTKNIENRPLVTHTENKVISEPDEHHDHAPPKKKLGTEDKPEETTNPTSSLTVTSSHHQTAPSRYKNRLRKWRTTLLKSVKLLLALLTLMAICITNTESAPTTRQGAINAKNTPAKAHVPTYDSLTNIPLPTTENDARAHTNPTHAPHPQKNKRKRIPLITTTSLNIMSVNIRGFTEAKMAALNTYNDTKMSPTDKADIIVISETKSSPAKGYNYVARAGWTFYPLHRNPLKPQQTNGGLALLIRTSSNITAHTPDDLPTDVHTSNETGMATWTLRCDNWETDTQLTACYWPTGRVPNSEVDTDKDHIQKLHTLLYQQSQHSTKSQPHHVVLGDFNLHLLSTPCHKSIQGAKETHTTNNTSNQRLAQAITENKYKPLSPIPSTDKGPPFTWYKTDSDHTLATTVDYVFGNKHTQDNTTHCKILVNSRSALNTDHEAIHTKLKIQRKITSQANAATSTRLFKVDLLQEPHVKDEVLSKARASQPALLQRMNTIAETPIPDNGTADQLFNLYTEHCTKAADSIKKDIDKTQKDQQAGKRKRIPEPSTNSTLRKLRTELLKNNNTDKSAGTNNRESTRQIEKAKHKEIIQRDRANVTKELQTLFDKSQGNNQQTLWKYVQNQKYKNSNTNKHTLPLLMKDTSGQILETPSASAKVWHDSRKGISKSHATYTATEKIRLQQLQHRVLLLQTARTACQDAVPINAPFTQKELDDILRALPNGKAPGSDGLPFELIKCTRQAYKVQLLFIYNYIWKHELAPTQWNTAVIHMLYKKNDPLIPENYRAIVLINTLKKIYEGLIANRLISHIQQTNCLHINQFGFLPNRNTTEAIFFLTESIRTHAARSNKPTYAAFIDFKTAFPNTCRPALWEQLHKLGIQGKIWNNLQVIYRDTKGRVLHPLIKDTDSYDINIGLLEGSKLSPILYAFLADSLLKRLQEKFPHIQIASTDPQNNTHTWNAALMYADDLALLATSQEELQELLDETQTWAEEHFAIINEDKSHIMIFMENQWDKDKRLTTAAPFHICHESGIPAPISQLREVFKFKYLGLILDPRLTFEPALNQTIQAFWYSHGQTRMMDVHVHGLHPKLQLTLWKQLVWSTTDTCLPFLWDPIHLKRLDKQINLSLASIFCPKVWNTDCVHKALRSDLGIPSAATLAKIATLRIFSHISQQADTMPAKALFTNIQYALKHKASSVSHLSLSAKMHTTLTELQQTHNWENTNLNITPLDQPRHQIAPKTRRRRWINHIAGKLARKEYELTLQWVKDQPREAITSITAIASGRPAQYLRNTQRDHERRLLTASLTKSPFQPFPYITNLSDASLVSNLLRIRTQNSTIPSHMSSIRHSNDGGPGKYRRIDFAERFCPACIPLRTAWGQAAPVRGSPVGTEEHLLLHCKGREAHRVSSFIKINQEVTDVASPSAALPEPWYDLTDQDKLQTLLACTPPQAWGMRKADEKDWYAQIEPNIQHEVTTLLALGTIYRQDIRKYYAHAT
jgi:hypothetical protein